MTVKMADPTPGLAASPLPQVEITSTPAPGLRGPKGLSPRTNYSKVQTGVPPQPDAGAMSQKSVSPMSAGMLPAKVASEESMGMMSTTPTLQDMVKAAMAGATARAQLAAEAARQQSLMGEKVAEEKCEKCHKEPCECKEKTSSATVSTEYAEKLAAALEYTLPMVKKAADLAGAYKLSENTQAPGEGPGALTVMEAKASKPLPDHKGQGHHQPPMHPGVQKSLPTGPTTQLENNKDHAPGGNQEMIQKNVGKTAAALSKKAEDEAKEKRETEGMDEAKKGLAKAEKAHEEEKKGSSSLVDHLLSLVKKAEDAINPAQISAGAAVPPEASAAGESGGAPAGGMPQGPRSLVHSNEAAINYNKAQSKAPDKVDLKKYLNEPALTNATDSVLTAAFEHSSAQDNNKMASAQGVTKTAAARALLAKLAEAAQAKVG